MIMSDLSSHRVACVHFGARRPRGATQLRPRLDSSLSSRPNERSVAVGPPACQGGIPVHRANRTRLKNAAPLLYIVAGVGGRGGKETLRFASFTSGKVEPTWTPWCVPSDTAAWHSPMHNIPCPTAPELDSGSPTTVLGRDLGTVATKKFILLFFLFAIPSAIFPSGGSCHSGFSFFSICGAVHARRRALGWGARGCGIATSTVPFTYGDVHESMFDFVARRASDFASGEFEGGGGG